MVPSPTTNSALYRTVLLGFFLLTFVGTYPFTQASQYEQGEADTLGRTITILLLLGALPLLWNYRADALRCARKSPVLCSLVILCCLSVLWSQYPSITVKRAALLFIITVVTLALATATRDLRQFHTALFVALTGIVTINIIFTLILPSVAIADEPPGVRGFYDAKNTAGQMTMIAVIVTGTWIAGASRTRDQVFGLLAMLMCLAFLVVTQSKTSIGLALLALMIFYTFAAANWFGDPVPRMLLGLTFAGTGAVLLGLLLIDFEILAIVEFLFGDTSFTGRDELWAFVYKMASSKPFLGFGYGAFWDVGPLNDPLLRLDPGTWLGDVELGVINQAHNGYLELWVQMGLPVMILAVGTVLATIAISARAAMSAQTSSQSKSCFGMIAVMLLTFLLHNTMEASLLMRGQALCNFVLLLSFVATQALARQANDRRGASI